MDLQDQIAERDELQRAIALGFSAEDFLESDLGRFIAERAEAERVSTIEELVSCDPFDSAAVARLQSRVAVTDAAMQWLADAVILGRQAQARLLQLDQSD
jgi:hypothetical protein